MMFTDTIDLINTIEKDGILAIDDTIVEKTGKNIEGAGCDLDPPRSDTFLPSFEEFNMFVPPSLFFDPFPSEIFILN